MTYEDLEIEWRGSADAIVCRTSGSTGTPSIIRLPKKQMRKSAHRTAQYFGLDGNSHLHSCIAADFIGGKMMLVRAMVLGCGFSFETPSNCPLDDYSGGAIDLISIVPSQMIHILDMYESVVIADNSVRELPELKNILIGGSPIPPGLRKRICESGLNVFESYGMTETSSHIAIRRVGNDEEYFHTLEGIKVSLSENGALIIHIEGWQTFHTNDIAEILDEKTFRILGRADNVIISGGKKIHPEEVEKKLQEAFDFPFMITSKKDEKWGEKVVMIVPAENLKRTSESRIIEKCRQICLHHEVPKEIIAIDELPTTENGKIKRIRLS